MMNGGSGARIQMFQHQADVTLSQANPVSGTKYEVLPTTKNVRVRGAMATTTWTVQNNPLEIHVTVDANSLIYSADNPVSATAYLAYNLADRAATAQGAVLPLNTAEWQLLSTFLLEGRSVKVEAETTGGTVSNLSARVKYAKIP